MVERQRRDVGDVVFRVQRAADGGPTAAGAEGDHPDLRDRSPLHRRRALRRRCPTGDRHARLPDVHGRVQRAAAGAVRVRRRVARRVATADRGERAVGPALARASERGRVLASWIEHRRVRPDRGGDARDRRACRRIPEHGVPRVRTAAGSQADPVRAVGALEPSRVDARAPDRPRAGDDRVVAPVAPRGSVDRDRSADLDLRAPVDRAGAGHRHVRGCVGGPAGGGPRAARPPPAGPVWGGAPPGGARGGGAPTSGAPCRRPRGSHRRDPRPTRWRSAATWG